MLTDQVKWQMKKTCVLKRFEEECATFIQQNVTGDKTCVHDYDPERKRQSTEYRRMNSPSFRKFKCAASARKVLLTLFWRVTPQV
ncbi:histone-lysine N-methyltransferase SETMAR-like protein [Plakobranchus ocellatus]|uniref:Histone-lysine N-methyltransferase SETMAR-like protein n=1 Tax=Plakobranchus ocellatus TaxID=259542 RepID=A0AAV4ACK7_9GAST|nr:histone-lysine N-methyltransferase SETMAR-like protein [Plakobranchus ocellatus]